MPGLSESGKCILSLELSNVQSSSAGLSRLSDSVTLGSETQEYTVAYLIDSQPSLVSL